MKLDTIRKIADALGVKLYKLVDAKTPNNPTRKCVQ